MDTKCVCCGSKEYELVGLGRCEECLIELDQSQGEPKDHGYSEEMVGTLTTKYGELFVRDQLSGALHHVERPVESLNVGDMVFYDINEHDDAVDLIFLSRE